MALSFCVVVAFFFSNSKALFFFFFPIIPVYTSTSNIKQLIFPTSCKSRLLRHVETDTSLFFSCKQMLNISHFSKEHQVHCGCLFLACSNDAFYALRRFFLKSLRYYIIFLLCQPNGVFSQWPNTIVAVLYCLTNQSHVNVSSDLKLIMHCSVLIHSKEVREGL